MTLRALSAPVLATALLACCAGHPDGGAGGGGGLGGGPGGGGSGGATPEICDNGIDDDGDGKADCADPDCVDDPHCPVCGDGFRDPREACDGADVGDDSCLRHGFNRGGILGCTSDCRIDDSACRAAEDCSLPGDEDHNNLADCADPACALLSKCLNLELAGPVGPIDVGEIGSVALRLTDGESRPVAGRSVLLAGPAVAVAPGEPAVTGADGIATFAVRVGRMPGEEIFHATVTGTELSLDVTVPAVDPPPGTIVTVLDADHVIGGDDSGLAITAHVNRILDVQVASDSTLYVAEACRILAVSPDGLLSRVAGGLGDCGTPQDGSRAADADLGVAALALDEADRTLYVADHDGGLLYAIDLSSGVLSIVAGGGSRKGLLADGGSLRDVDFAPNAVALASDGTLLVSDGAAQLLWRLDPIEGRLHLFAATAAATDPNCRDPLRIASCDSGCRVAFDSAGTPFVLATACGSGSGTGGGPATSSTPALVRMDPTVPAYLVGTGSLPLAEDELASLLDFEGPLRGVFDPGGNLLAVSGNRLIRIDGQTGRFRTLGGGMAAGLRGEDVPVGQAGFDLPGAVALGPGGDLYVADTGNATVRRIAQLAEGLPQTISVAIVSGDGQTGGLASELPDTLTFRLTDASGAAMPLQPVAVIPADPSVTVESGYGTNAMGEANRHIRLGIRPGDVTLRAGVADIHGGAGATPAIFHLTASTPAEGEIFALAGEDGEAPVILDPLAEVPTPHVHFVIAASMAVAADGTVYLAEAHQVLRLDASGRASRFAGTGSGGVLQGDGGRAIDATINPQLIATDDSLGAVYFIDDDGDTSYVRWVDLASGIIRRLAGGGPLPAGSGDGGQALDANIDGAASLALDSDGKIYLGDSGTAIRVIDPTAGTIDSFLPYVRSCSGDPGLLYARGITFEGKTTYIAGIVCDGENVVRGVLRRDEDGTLAVISHEDCQVIALAGAGQLACGGQDPDDPNHAGHVDRVDLATGASIRIAGGGPSIQDHIAATTRLINEIHGVRYHDGHLLILEDLHVLEGHLLEVW